MKVLHSSPSIGIMIQELYLSPTGISTEQAAALCQIDKRLFDQIMTNEQEIGYELAYKLAKGFNTTHQFWLNIQKDYQATKNPSD